jgi:hypothetical protein
VKTLLLLVQAKQIALLLDLRIVVLFQADACDCTCGDTLPADHLTTSSTKPILAENILGEQYSDFPSTHGQEQLQVIRAGTEHEARCLVHFNARDDQDYVMHDVLARMWFTQQRVLYTAGRVRGLIIAGSAEKRDLSHLVARWGSVNAANLTMLNGLLSSIRNTAGALRESSREERFSLIYKQEQQSDDLELYRREGGQEMLV